MVTTEKKKRKSEPTQETGRGPGGRMQRGKVFDHLRLALPLLWFCCVALGFSISVPHASVSSPVEWDIKFPPISFKICFALVLSSLRTTP